MAGFFGRLLGRERAFDAPPPAARFGLEIPPELAQFFTEGVVSERRISRSQALSVPAVMRARNLICGTLATLPIRHIGPDMKSTPWPLFDQPDPELPTSVMWAYTYEDLLFESVSWWRVTAFGWHGFPVEAVHVPISSVHVSGTPSPPSQSRNTPDQPFPANGQVFIDGYPVPDREIIRLDSPNPPLLVSGARAIRTCLLLDAAAALYAKEPLPLGYFSPEEGVDGPSREPGSAGDETDRSEAEAMLDDWELSRRTRSWGYIDGLKPNILQWDPKKLQLSEQRQHAVLEISRVTNLDPEYLGVNVATRTYQNSEQRRQDLIDFNLGGYLSAVQDRLSMRDVTMRGYLGRIDFGGFLRGDTKTRMETYDIGLRVGAYTKDEIRHLEDKPPLTDAQKRESAPAPQEPPQQEDPAMERKLKVVDSARFADEADHTVVTFDDAEVAEAFRVNPEKRTISGLAVPWGKVARSGFASWRFAEGSLHWSTEARIKLNLHHDRQEIVGKAIRLQSTSKGLDTTFKVGRGPDGDRALEKAEDGLLDGFSIEVDFDPDAGDEWQPDPSDESVRLVRSGTLRGVALTGNPAFDDARVSRVAATRDGRKGAMPDDKKPESTPGEGSVELDAGEFTKFMGGLAEQIAGSHKTLTEELGKSIGESVAAGVKVALESISTPQDGPEPVRAARFTVTREAPIYSFDGAGPCLVRDAWYAQKEHDDDARDRLRKFHQQSDETQKLVASHVASQAASQAQFANQPGGTQFATSTTGTSAAVIPPGYRPDLFVPMLEQGRPFVNALSRGTIQNATPFVVPVFGNLATGTGDHSEGNAPTEGTLTFTTKTVTPGAVSGKLPLTREIVDSSNPAIDQIALAAMRESYARQTEAKVYALLNGTNGQGGVITAGFVPSGAQVAFTGATPTGAAVVKKVREQLALYPFRRFNSPNRALLSQRATTSYATAEDGQQRPLLPSVGAQNSVGMGNAVQVGWFVDGLANVPAWAITGVGTTDGDVFILNSSDAWAWESPILSFRFEEKQGPQIIELALFGYFATHLLRPVGLSVVRASAGV